MPLAQSTKIYEVAKSGDTAKAIWEAVGDISGIRVRMDWVLIGIHIRSEKMGKLGLLIRPDTNIVEDEYQSKTGIVLKKGPDAFDSNVYVSEDEIFEGDWVSFAVKDGLSLHINGFPCRLIHYDRIIMKLKDPTVVF